MDDKMVLYLLIKNLRGVTKPIRFCATIVSFYFLFSNVHENWQIVSKSIGE